MSITYPTSIDSFPSVTSTTRTDTGVPHAELHMDELAAIIAIEQLLGITGDTDPATLIGKIASLVSLSKITASPTSGPTFFDMFLADASSYEVDEPVFLSDGLGNSLYGSIDYIDYGTGEIVVHAFFGIGVQGDPLLIPADTKLLPIGRPGQNGNDGVGWTTLTSGGFALVGSDYVLTCDGDVAAPYPIGLWIYVSDGTNSLRAQVNNNTSAFGVLKCTAVTATVVGSPTSLSGGQYVVAANGLDGATGAPGNDGIDGAPGAPGATGATGSSGAGSGGSNAIYFA